MNEDSGDLTLDTGMSMNYIMQNSYVENVFEIMGRYDAFIRLPPHARAAARRRARMLVLPRPAGTMVEEAKYTVRLITRNSFYTPQRNARSHSR